MRLRSCRSKLQAPQHACCPCQRMHGSLPLGVKSDKLIGGMCTCTVQVRRAVPWVLLEQGAAPHAHCSPAQLHLCGAPLGLCGARAPPEPQHQVGHAAAGPGAPGRLQRPGPAVQWGGPPPRGVPCCAVWGSPAAPAAAHRQSSREPAKAPLHLQPSLLTSRRACAPSRPQKERNYKLFKNAVWEMRKGRFVPVTAFPQDCLGGGRSAGLLS